MKLEIDDKEISLLLEKVLREEVTKDSTVLQNLIGSKLDVYFKSEGF